jgi:tRNA(adenine34) deaminase
MDHEPGNLLNATTVCGFTGFASKIACLIIAPGDRSSTDSPMETDNDIFWMEKALALAHQAAEKGEVPVGAVIVRDGELLAEGFNQPISSVDPTSHAEIAALRNAAKNTDNYRLSGATLYVTIEPCTMCVGAMIHARIARVVFGAREPRAGAVVSQLQLPELQHYNHRMSWSEGVLAEQCGEVISRFFRERRRS